MLILALYIALTKHPGRRKVSAWVLVISMWFFTNPLISNLIVRAWEVPPTAYQSIEKHRYGVLLSGVTVPRQTPTDRVHYQKGADRVLHTLDLWRLGIIEKIVVTGGSGLLIGSEESEALKISRTLQAAGVPVEDILLEEAARNTAENAQFTRQLINTDAKIILITSAFHMRRAKKCFEKVNFKVTPFATDLYATPISVNPDDWLYPKTSSLEKWDIVIKEWLGYVAYQLRGYL